MANWTDPAGGSVGKRNFLALGLALDARWRITPDIEVNQRLAGYLGVKGAQWMVNLGWTL
jgi:hypothetical protein